MDNVCGECLLFMQDECPQRDKFSQWVDGKALMDKNCSVCPDFKMADINIKEALKKIYTQFIFKTPTDIENIYYYDNGIYREAEHKIKALLEHWYEEKATTHIVEEVLNHIRRSSYIERSEFNKQSEYLPVKNGLLNLKTLTIEQYNENRIFTFKLNIEYKPEAKCPNFTKFLEQILEASDIQTLQEFFGYCLLPAMPYHKMMWLYGAGRNGKGRLILTLQAILGHENCSDMNIEEFNGDRRFSAARLYGKMINVSSEPSTTKTLQTPLLKKITGEDWIEGEIKNKQQPIKFLNFAKLFVLGNRFPKVNDTTLAFWDRVLLIRFPNSFVGGKQIPNIEKQWINNQDEMSGILNWMLEGLIRLCRNNNFTESKSTHEAMVEFKRVSDSIMAFIEEYCQFIAREKISKHDLYDEYKLYCENIDIEIESDKKFTQKLKQLPRVKEEVVRSGSKTERVWFGVKLKRKVGEEIDGVQQSLINGENVTDVTDVTVPAYSTELSKNSYIEKSSSLSVTTVTTVTTPNQLEAPEQPKIIETSNGKMLDLTMNEVYEIRVCGDCFNFGKGECEYPSGPDSVKADYSWAGACRGFKNKNVLPDYPEENFNEKEE